MTCQLHVQFVKLSYLGFKNCLSDRQGCQIGQPDSFPAKIPQQKPVSNVCLYIHMQQTFSSLRCEGINEDLATTTAPRHLSSL